LPPPLSVVIPSHNRPDLLQLCLQSVTSHAPNGTEIIVVDDASADGSVSAAAQQFAGVRVLRLDRRGGFCVAANTGIRAAQSAVVELLNDDTEVSPGWADAALAHFDDASIGAVAPLVLCKTTNAEQQCVDSAGDCYFVGGVAGKRGHGRPVGPDWLQGGEVFGASASSAFYRRDLVVSLGGFPEHFGAYFEDVDLAFRLHRAGARVWYEPRSRVWHRVSASYGAPAAELLQRQSRNEELVFWRNVPASDLWLALPLHAAVLAGKAWRRWREGHFLSFVRGRLQALGETAAILHHRRWLRQQCGSSREQAWPVEWRYRGGQRHAVTSLSSSA
jgi:GT2 family glycosyltransferase